jgi:hypothetical protein
MGIEEVKKIEKIRKLEKKILDSITQEIKQLYNKQSEYFAIIRTKIAELKSKLEEFNEKFSSKMKNLGDLESLSLDELDTKIIELERVKIPSINLDFQAEYTENNEMLAFLLYDSKLLKIDILFDRISHHDLRPRDILINALDSSIKSYKNTIFIHSGSTYKSFLYKISAINLDLEHKVKAPQGSYLLDYVSRRLFLFKLNSEDSSIESQSTLVFIYKPSLDLIKESKLEINNIKTTAVLNSIIFLANFYNIWQVEFDKENNELNIVELFTFKVKIYFMIGISKLYLVTDEKLNATDLYEFIDKTILEIKNDCPKMTILDKKCIYITDDYLEIIDFEYGKMKKYKLTDF